MRKSEIEPVVPCPVCKGVARSIHPGGGKAFPTMLDPNYRKLRAGETWNETFWVCAACAGTGRQEIALERLLSGAFVPKLSYMPRNLEGLIESLEAVGITGRIAVEMAWNCGYDIGRSRWFWGPRWVSSFKGWVRTQFQRLKGWAAHLLSGEFKPTLKPPTDSHPV